MIKLKFLGVKIEHFEKTFKNQPFVGQTVASRPLCAVVQTLSYISVQKFQPVKGPVHDNRVLRKAKFFKIKSSLADRHGVIGVSYPLLKARLEILFQKQSKNWCTSLMPVSRLALAWCQRTYDLSVRNCGWRLFDDPYFYLYLKIRPRNNRIFHSIENHFRKM